MSIDKLTRVSFYALIYFLPISIALAESFMGFIAFLFLLKRTKILILNIKGLHGNHFVDGFQKFIQIFFISFKPIENRLNRPLMVFLWLSLISIIFVSSYPLLSLRGFVGKELALIVLFLAFIESFSSKKHLNIFISILLISATLVSISGIVQYSTGTDFLRGRVMEGNRVTSSWSSTHAFGSYLAIVLSFLVTVFSSQRFRLENFMQHRNLAIRTIWQGLLLILSLICLGLTFSRSAWIAFAIGLIFFGFLQKRTLWTSMLIIIIFMFVFMPRLKAIRDVTIITENMTPCADQGFWDCSGNGRFALWADALEVIKQNPLLGIGLNTYYKRTDAYVHNSFLQLTAEMGLSGLGVFLWILFTVLREAYFHLKAEQDVFLRNILLGATIGLVMFLTQAFFDSILYSAQLRHLFGILLGIIMVMPRLTMAESRKNG